MKDIRLNWMAVRNFKGIKELEIEFDSETSVYGANGTGKTTICDAFFWALFDKDSNGNQKFEIRPLTEDGKTVDNVEIDVEVNLTVGEETVILGKTQKQKWVKKRGSETATFQGNENQYEINGFPATLKEYQQRVDEIISEQLFKLLTSPRTFAAMKWQDQRKILLQMVPEISDEDILSSSLLYDDIREDVLAAGSDKALEKAKKLMTKLKEVQKEYPTRIDEASRAIVEVPEREALDLERNALTEELENLKKEETSLSETYKEAADIREELMHKKFALIDFDNEAIQHAHTAYMSVKDEHDKLDAEAGRIFKQKRELADQIAYTEASLERYQTEMASIRKEYSDTLNEKMPAGSLICPTCGREFPEDKAEKIIADFDERHEERVALIREKGDQVYAKIKGLKADLEGMKQKAADMEQAWTEAASKKGKAYERMVKTPETVDVMTLPGHIEIEQEMAELQKKLNAMSDGETAKQNIRDREKEVQSRLDDVNRQFALIEANLKAEERVEELREELLETSQKVADQERIVYLLEQFSRAKMDVLSETINQKFDVVRFKLFDIQINGATRDTCEMTVNGVPYASLNSAAKIQGGLDVINALSEFYGVTAPIFIDNRESTTHIPKMDAQIINLYVSDADKELRVEVSE